jgi:hypothetical protein
MQRELWCCEHGDYDPHPCPFQIEMSADDEDYCTCCPECTDKCAEDV